MQPSDWQRPLRGNPTSPREHPHAVDFFPSNLTFVSSGVSPRGVRGWSGAVGHGHLPSAPGCPVAHCSDWMISSCSHVHLALLRCDCATATSQMAPMCLLCGQSFYTAHWICCALLCAAVGLAAVHVDPAEDSLFIRAHISSDLASASFSASQRECPWLQ